MFRPILSSTLVTVAVFAPLVFVGGMVGELFLPFALTMAFALGASLLVAITVVPSLSHTLFRKQLMRRAQANTGAVEGGKASAEREASGNREAFAERGVSADRGASAERETSAEPGTSAHRETSGAASAPFDPARYARLDAVIHAAREAAGAEGEEGSSAGGRYGAKAAKEVLSRTGKYRRGRSGGGHEGLGVLARAYKRMLAWALRHKAATFSGAVVLLAASLFLLPAVGISFIDYNASEKMMYFTYTPAKGEDPETTNAQVAVAEELMMARDDVRVVQISIGSGGNPMAAMLGGGTDGALMFVAFDPDTRHFDRVTEEVTEQITSLEATGAWKVQDFASMGFSSDEMSYTVYGHDLDSVEQAVRQIEKIMRQAENITDVSSSLSDAYVQQTLHVDANKAMQVGLTTAQIAMMLNPNRTEDVLTTIRKDGRNVRVVVRQEVDTAKSFERLLDRQIPTPAGVTVRLGDLVQVEEDLVASRLDRSAGRYYASVSGKIISRDVSAASREVDEKIRSLQLPDGVELGESGVIADIEETFTQLGVAMAVAVLIVYFILVVTFGEGLAPFAILFSLPFVAIGSLAGLWLAGETLSVTAMMGLLMLIGIVVTNAIVLVDRIIRKEREGLDIREAILEAGATRLRPILMTALATVGALLPLVIGAEGGAGFISRGLAVTVIGGLTSSTLLTLVIVPIVYEWLSKVFRKRRNAPEMI
jgi:HAE1 family hydrophobic/amphiphilic exporter-1